MFKKINSALERIFDEKNERLPTYEQIAALEPKKFQSPETMNFFENLSYVLEGEVKPSQVFLQLLPYFEMGFLLRKKSTSNMYAVEEAFIFSKRLETCENFKPLKLPQVQIFKILKTPAAGLLRHFKTQQFDPDSKMFSYLIPITPHHALIVMTPQAEPWAQVKIEALKETLMKICFSL